MGDAIVMLNMGMLKLTTYWDIYQICRTHTLGPSAYDAVLLLILGHLYDGVYYTLHSSPTTSSPANSPAAQQIELYKAGLILESGTEYSFRGALRIEMNCFSYTGGPSSGTELCIATQPVYITG